MKKITLSVLIFAALFNLSIFAEENTSSDWAEIGQQGKKVLQETGELLKQAGKIAGNAVTEKGKEIGNQLMESISDSYKNETTVQCYGTWLYTSEKTKTTLQINKDGTMSVTQKSGLETKFWNGTYSATPHLLNFKISESGNKFLFIKLSETKEAETWFMAYSVKDDTMKLTCASIPDDESGTSFSKITTFIKL